MKYSIWILLSVIFSASISLSSMPAFPKQILVCGSSGDTVKLSLRGDENCKYAIEETSEFTAVLDSTDCWRYLKIGNLGMPEISTIKVSDINPKNLKAMLNNTPKGLIPISSKPMKSRTIEHEAFVAGNNNVTGDRKALIILAEFPDKKLHFQPSDFELLFNMPNYSLYNATGSVADYFKEVSEGQLNLESTIIGPFTAKRNMSYYGRNTSAGGSDANPYELFKEALEYAKSAVNLNDYDCNGDSYIDNIHIIYAGYGEEAGASSNTIWAHECTFTPIKIDMELKIDRYSCSPELRGNNNHIITTIGPPCHEICHALGAMDFYDTDYSQRGEYQGTASWDIMASGSWNNGGATPAWPNPYIRAYNFGWAEPELLNCDGSFDFGNLKRKIYRINTSEDNDYYLLEFRDGKYFSASDPGRGMLIFHIGPDIDRYSLTNSINATYPQQCYPVCASSNYSIPTSNPVSYGDLNSASCPFSDITGYTSFSGSTIPGAFSFSGKKSDFSVSDIHFEEDNISFIFFTCSGDINEVESNVLWQESFKSNDVLKYWEQTNIAGKAQWDRFNNLGEALVRHYLSLIPNKNCINPRKIKTKLLSPKISLLESTMVYETPSNQSSELIFSAKIRNVTKNTSTWNFCFVDSEHILSEFKIDLEPNKEWFQLTKEMSIDLSERESIRLIIETEMEIGADSRLELSDLNLIFQEPSAQIPIIFEDCFSEGNYKIFDISGRMIQLCDIAKLPNGVYIIKSQSEVKKILINDKSKITLLNNLRNY